MRFFITLLFVANAFAIPQQISYQGSLTNLGGTPLDTTVAVTFKLYNGSGGGATLLWTEAHPSVTVTDGLFNQSLGSVTTLNDAVFNNSEVWLGVTVGSNTEMIPREQIVSVAHAYRVGTVDGAGGGTISGKLNVGSGNTNGGDFANVFGENCSADGAYSTVSGGFVNQAIGNNSTVSGGAVNYASGQSSTIGGGNENAAFGQGAVVSGGLINRAIAPYAFVGGGAFNTSDGEYSVIGGGGGPLNFNGNWAEADYSAILGGSGNYVSGYSGAIGGGRLNQAGNNAFVGGGNYNKARGDFAVVVGGGGDEADSNCATGNNSAIGGGKKNNATALYATVGGGQSNLAGGLAATVDGGELNSASNNYATVGGGRNNRARGEYSVVAGGGSASEFDSNAATGNCSVIGGGLRNKAFNERAVVGGGFENAAGYSATIGGGEMNYASAYCSTIGGGRSNITSFDSDATISGGRNNEADGEGAAIGGGQNNNVHNDFGTIPGGKGNYSGMYGFAAGLNATAGHGSFIWNGSSTESALASANYSVVFRCENGATFYTHASNGSTGVNLPAGGGAWNSLCDKNQKNLHGNVNTSEILQKVSSLSLYRWSYKAQSDKIQHIGPTAQDFHAAFGLGDNNTTISTLDPDGVALAAIQELAKQVKELQNENKELRALIENQMQFGVNK